MARLYSKLISSPPFVLTLLTFHLFDFVEALQPPDMLPSFFGSSAFARPALHFQVAISLYRSLSLSLCFLRTRIYTIGTQSRMAARESLCSPIEEDVEKRKIVGAEDANKRRFCRGSLDLVENPCRTATIYYRGGSGRGIRSGVAAAYKHEERGRRSGARAYAPQLTPLRAFPGFSGESGIFG